MKALRVLLPLAAAWLLVSCFNDKLEPVAPTWDVDLTLPITNHQYTVQDLIDKDPSLVTSGSDNQIFYQKRSAAPGDSVKDAISISPAPSQRRIKVGVFNLDDVALSVSFPLPFLPGGTSVQAIPDTIVTMPDLLDTVGTFLSTTLESGTLSMTIQNNIPDTLIVVGDISLSDSLAQFATLGFAGTRLNPGQSATRTADLSNKTVTRIVRISSATFHLLRRVAPPPINIPNGPLVQTSIAMTSLRARSAVVAHIPQQRLTNNDTTSFTFSDITDSTIVKFALFKSGSITLRFSSLVAIDLSVIAAFPQVSTTSGGVFSDSVAFPKFSTQSSTINLQKMQIHDLPEDNGLVRQLRAVSSIWIPAATNVTLNDTDHILVDCTPSGRLIADSAVAVIKPTWITVNSTVPLNLTDIASKFNGTLTIPSAGLTLNTVMTVGCPVDLHVQLTAKNRTTGVTVVLNLPGGKQRLDPAQPMPIAVNFDSAAVGTFLSSLAPRFPDSITISGSVEVNPEAVYDPTPAGVRSISSRSFVRDTVVLGVPLRLSLAGGVFRDTSDQTFDPGEVDRMNSGTIAIEVQNGLPVRTRVRATFLDSVRTRVLVIPQSGTPVDITPAPVGPHGTAISAATSTVSITLTANEVRSLKRVRSVVYEVFLDTTPGGPVRFLTTDSFHLKSWAQLSYRVSK